MVIRAFIAEFMFLFLWVERDCTFFKAFVMVLVFESCKKEEGKEAVFPKKSEETSFAYYC
jgi:hypothetical protein